MLFFRLLLLSFALFGAGLGSAYAHPHVFVKVETRILFTPRGEVQALYHRWIFDGAYSAFAIAGLKGAGGRPSEAELQNIARQNMQDLKEYQWFTKIRFGASRPKFKDPVEYKAEFLDKGELALSFLLPLEQPQKMEKVFTFQVYDPTYFVAFTLSPSSEPTLEGAPKGCSVQLYQPTPLNETQTKLKDESFFSGLSPGADFGALLAQRVIVACP